MNRREFLKKSARFGLGGVGLAGLMGSIPGCGSDKSKNYFGTAGRQRLTSESRRSNPSTE